MSAPSKPPAARLQLNDMIAESKRARAKKGSAAEHYDAIRSEEIARLTYNCDLFRKLAVLLLRRLDGCRAEFTEADMAGVEHATLTIERGPDGPRLIFATTPKEQKL
mgnify:CR=1 FL=1